MNETKKNLNDINCNQTTTSLNGINCKETNGPARTVSQIFCDGPLLEAVQSVELFKDSKTFVDLHLKDSPDNILIAFDKLGEPSNRDVMANFVAKYFDPPNPGEIGPEFEKWCADDWQERPTFLSKIRDESLRDWAKKLHLLWKVLGRKVNSDVADHPDRYSLIPVSSPFIVPGGRFREFYYWDSYWVIKGLLISDMTKTVHGMLSNFAEMIYRSDFGFVPNGNRLYYANRSQPPYLTPSVYEYLKATGDFDFVKSILPALEKEYKFWMEHRSVRVKKPGNDKSHLLNRYCVSTDKPRPESFREDTETARCSTENAETVYSNLASAAESGWDFSSRWLGGNHRDLAFIRTKHIVPVDLNSVLCLNEKILSEFFERAGQQEKAKAFMEAHSRRRSAIQEIFWVENTGAWMDFDLETSQNRDGFYPSNIMPLWANCYAEGNGDVEVEKKVLGYLKNLGVLDYVGGIPTSLKETGQQWDYPNAWPPLQEMTIQALASSSLSEARDHAFKLAQKWTTTNWVAYQKQYKMFEKYRADKQGVSGHGGEYDPQHGFGWTNGVILTLLDKYGDRLTSVV